MSEIKEKLKFDEIASRVRKIPSMLVDLWKSSPAGKCSIITSCTSIILLLIIVCGGNKETVSMPPAAPEGKNPSPTVSTTMQEVVAAAQAVAEARKAQAAAAISRSQVAVAQPTAVKPAVPESDDDEEETKPKVKIEIKDLASAKRAFEVASDSGDDDLMQKALKAIGDYSNREAEDAAKKEAEEQAKEQARLEAERKAEAAEEARIAKEREARKAAMLAAEAAIPDKLAVKGLYAHMSGDSALAACQQLVKSSPDLEVIDFRKGVDREKDAATKAAEKKAWDALVKLAETDVGWFLKWNDLNGNTFKPADEECTGPAGGVSVRWSGNKNVKIPGPNYTLGTSLGMLAAVNGYQLEWMLPGRKSATDADQAKNVPQATLTVIETLKASEIVKSGGIDGLLRRSVDSSWQGTDFDKKLYPKVYDQGLRIHRHYKGHLFFRLVPRDESGKDVSKSDLATEIACNFSCLFAKGSSRAEMVKGAEAYVDAILGWIDGHKARRTSNYQSDKVKNEYSGCLHQLIDRGYYASIMDTLVNNLKVSVEFGVPVEPVEKFAQLVQQFSIPCTAPQEVGNYMRKMNINLGRFSDSTVGSDGSRKRLFFKHDLEDVRSPLWFRLLPKTTNGVEVTREELVNNWLNGRGHYKPSDRIKIPPKNLIQVAIKQDGVAIDKLKGLCFVSTDDAGNVSKIYFTAMGMERFFDAKNLTGEQFANKLVTDYPGLPSLKMAMEEKDPGRGRVKECTWIYNCPKGYRIELFERYYVNANGVRYDDKMFERDAEVTVALSLVDLFPCKHLSITAVKVRK